MATLEEVADRLYALLPGEFVAARDAESKELRGTDRELATAVKELRRPSTAAWAVNLLVRQREDLLEQVLDLGASLRQAQAGLQGEELRALVKQRRQLISAVTDQARALAAESGQRLTDQVARQVEDTISAAMADEAAAQAVRSGTLTDALESSGLGSLGVGNVVGVLRPVGKGGRARSSAKADAAREEARARLERATAALSTAEARLARSTEVRAEREAKVLQLQAELEEVRRRTADLEHAVDRAVDALDQATEDMGASAEQRDEAKAEVQAAAQDTR